MAHTLIGYARCSTDKQDLAAQQDALLKLGVIPDRIYTDRGFTGTNRARPGLDQALAAVRRGDTLVRRFTRERIAMFFSRSKARPDRSESLIIHCLDVGLGAQVAPTSTQ